MSDGMPATTSATTRPGDLRARPAERGVLSFGQQRLWFLHRWLDGSPVYHAPFVLTFRGPVDRDRLLASVVKVAARHDVLFSVFTEEDGMPRQHRLEGLEVDCPVIDLTGEPAGRRHRRADELIRAHSRQPFDLTTDPMLRASLYKIADDEHWLALTLHHIACDGWSVDVFQRQLLEAYAGGEPAASLPVQYADYALWQRERLTGHRLESGLATWAEDLRGAPPLLDLGSDHPRPPELSYRGATVSFPLAGAPVAELEQLGASTGATLYMVLLAAFQALVARHSGNDDIVLGSPSAARGLAKLDELVGFFIDSLVIRVSLAGGPSFRELISRTRTSVIEALSRGAVPFDLAVSHLHPERSLSYNPVFQVVFAFHEEDRPVTLPGEVEVRRTLLPTDTAKFDLTWSVYRGADGLRLEVEYSTDLFEPATIAALVGHWQTLLTEVAASPDAPVGTINLMPAAEARSLRQWSGARSPAGGPAEDGTVPGLVAAAAAATPDEVAVACGNDTLTYRELDERSTALARRLRALGVGPERFVGVLVEPSLETVVASLAVLKAGGAYVPLDAAFPAERIELMLADAGTELVLAHCATAASVPAGPWRVLELDASQELDVSQEPSESASGPPLLPVDAGNACYVIFTSGTTGRPKGTLVTQANVTRLIRSARRRLDIGPGDVWTMFHSLAFDFSVWEIWGALTTGGRVVVVPSLVSRDTEAFYGLVRDAGVTVLSQTPSAFRQFEAVDARLGAELSLRAVVFGGEALDQACVRRWAARHGHGRPRLINMYGITETTVHVTFGELDEAGLSRAATQLGVPLPGMRVHVLDERGEPCPAGVPGEIYVGGPGVSRGYLHRPELTAGRFVPDHLGGPPGGRLYRSGDLARWNADGGLEYLGRSDTQVKVRGYRIELGEIEAALTAHPGVREGVVAAWDDGGQTSLAAYLVPHETAPSASDLRGWLSERLPAYMIPRAFVVIDALPVTSQGKLDRQALRRPQEVRPDLDTEFVPPWPGAEETLAGIWRQVLRVDRVGRHDNFFDLGGDSIRSIQVVGQAKASGLQVALQDLFRHQALADLAAAAGRGQSPQAGPRVGPDLAPFAMVAAEERDRLPEGLQDAYPMTELQVGMVYEMELNPGRNSYHNLDSLKVAGVFDEVRFGEAVALVVERHPVLRTSFDLSGFGEPMQLVHAGAELPVRVWDVRELDEAAQDAVIAEYVESERGRLFDHSRPPLLRFGIHVRSGELFQWTVTEHHAIFDGWSLHSTWSEIAAVYQRLLAGEAVPKPPLVSNYRDFVVAERAAASSEESSGFWLGKVADRPDCRLPRWPAGRAAGVAGLVAGPGAGDEWRLRSEGAGYGAVETLLPAPLCEGVVALARRCGVAVKSVVLAAHLRVMSLVTGSADLLVGLTANGRLEERDGAEVRGLFLNTVPLRMRLPQGSWLDLIRAVFDAERELLPHRRYPLGVLQRKLGGAPLFEVNFVYNHFHVMDAAFGAGQMEILDEKIQSFTSLRMEPTNFPLNVGFLRSPFSARMLLALDYHTDVLADDQVLLMRDYYLRVLEEMTASPGMPHHLAALTGEAERALTASWNGPAVRVPPTLVHQMVQARAAAAPDAAALVSGPDQMTYGELNTRSNQLARKLRGLGAGPDVAVGLCLERSVDMIVALLAILKAGGVYVPLDAAFPADRLAYMLSQAGAPLVLAHDRTVGRLPAGPWHILNLDTDPPPPGTPTGDLPELATPDNGCYIIFTSGSTGQPKGVLTRHRNVTELLHGGSCLTLTPADTLLQLAPLPFDNSTFELWAPLTAGARLVLAPPIQYGPADIAAWVTAHQVTVLHVTASLFALLVDHEPQLFDHLRRFLTGSEPVSARHAAQILARCPHLELVNCWGPTETTTFSVCGTFTHDTLPDGPLPLGTPLANTQVYVLDQAGQPVPVGTPGELHVAGPCLARGYLNNPVLTGDRFTPHPHNPGHRLYRTGDRGRWTPHGQIEFLGRLDHMVKIRGYRVEPGEIETALRTREDIRECVVVVRHESGQPDLVAYLVAEERPPAIAELRAWLRGRVPEYMVPGFFVFLDALPLTARAKIDRAALPAPAADSARPELDQPFVAPRPGVEELLASFWRRVLGLDQVGRHDNLFDLGVDSIRSIQMLGLARTAGLRFALQDIFRHPTLAELGQVADAAGQAAAPPDPFTLIAPEDRDRLPEGLQDAYPMAELQVGMVYEMERDPERLPYHNVHSLRVAAPFDEEKFRAAVARVVQRHPILRTAFALTSYREPIQLVYPAAEIELTVSDLRARRPEAQRAEVAEFRDRERHQGFDLSVAPLCRMGAHLLEDATFLWTITEHHGIFDGWSLASACTEIIENYQLLLAGQEPHRRPMRSLYRDFIVAERAALQSPDSEGFWLDKVSDRPDSRLPRWQPGRAGKLTGQARDGEQHNRNEERGWGDLSTLLPQELLTRLTALARRCGVPLKSVVLAAHLRVISMVTGRTDLLFGFGANGRLEEEDGAEVLGLFMNTVPLRVRLPAGSWLDLIRAAFDAEREMLPHRRYPLGALQRLAGGGAMLEVNFGYNNFRQLASESSVSVAGQQEVGAGGMARTNFPLVVAVSHEPGTTGLRLDLEYDARELTPDQVSLLRDYYLRALDSMTADPEADHQLAPLLGEAEQALAASWNDTAAAIPPVPVHRMVQTRAAAAPEAVAVVCGADSLTYGQLNTRANQLAWRLRELGVGPEVFVGVCLERSAEMVVALLAVLKAGGAYVPLDAALPADRLAFMLRQAGAPVVLVHDSTADLLPAGLWQVINLDTDAPAEETADPPDLVTGDNACYVIFTSGSTGQPKGVVSIHRNVTELLHGGDCLTLAPADTVLQLASLSFDVSTFEVWAPLAAGARLVLAPPARYGPADIAAWAAGHGVTVLHVTASLFALLVEHEPQLFDQLRRCLTGSETVSARHAAQILARCPRLELVNCWGPTETTTFSACGTFTRDTLPDGPVPLGTPLANTQVYALGQAGQPVPAGTPGELYVSGSCLARGYLNNPALTAERFTPHPTIPGARLYRTGDLGRWSPDGQIDFLGRADHMVKIRGYRVELGEVEAALERSPDVQQATALAAPGPYGDSELRAYAAAAIGRQPDGAALRAYLESVLPRYMVPSVIIVLRELPVNANGKVDTGALLAMERTPQAHRADTRPPRTALEQEIAAIWAQTLEVEVADVRDDFFGLGGTSLLAVRMLFLLQDRLLVDLPLAALMRASDLKTFSEEVEKQFAELTGDVDLGSAIAEQTDEARG
jgi:amino acid adenylation domain-containing protein